MGYFMITALFFFILYDSVGTYYILVYEKKEEKEKKIKMKPYVEKLKYDSFKEIYNLFKDKLVNEGYKEKLINITTSTKVYIFEKTKFLNRDYIVLVDTKKYSKVQLYLISEELEKYNNDLKSEYQTYTRVIFVAENKTKEVEEYVNAPISQGYRFYNLQGIHILKEKKLYIPKNYGDYNKLQYNKMRKDIIKVLNGGTTK